MSLYPRHRHEYGPVFKKEFEGNEGE
jgi:hypothetical protein